MGESIKTKLYDYCCDQVDDRLDRIGKAMLEAQQAANEESKSSMGDKYETTRAMMQLEKEKLAGQAQEAQQLKRVLAELNLAASDSVRLGSLVETKTGSYFLAVSLGKVILEGKSYFVVSPAAPIGKAMLGKAVGESFSFNGISFDIKSIK